MTTLNHERLLAMRVYHFPPPPARVEVECGEYAQLLAIMRDAVEQAVKDLYPICNTRERYHHNETVIEAQRWIWDDHPGSDSDLYFTIRRCILCLEALGGHKWDLEKLRRAIENKTVNFANYGVIGAPRKRNYKHKRKADAEA